MILIMMMKMMMIIDDLPNDDIWSGGEADFDDEEIGDDLLPEWKNCSSKFSREFFTPVWVKNLPEWVFHSCPSEKLKYNQVLHFPCSTMKTS